MQSVPIYSLTGEEKGRVNLPKWFSSPVRPDLIKKAVLAEQSIRIHPYGSDPLAGQRSSARYFGRRGAYHSMMNREISRMKRIVNQGFLNLTARVVPQSTKGRKAHPPKPWKNWEKKINKKERLLALHNAIAASFDKNIVKERGHNIEGKHIPLVLNDNISGINKTKDLIVLLKKFGFTRELERCSKRKVRAGKGKARGRKYKIKKGPLVIVNEDKGIMRIQKIPGIDVVNVKDLRVEDFAPGTHPGRLTVWSKTALENFK